MEYGDAELLQLSGIQHFSFCRRQWALIHLEHLWQENWRTTEGNLFHRCAHDVGRRERRGDTLIIRGLPVVSHALGISGQCDVVEFHRDPSGISLNGEKDLWIPYPVEYKHGTPKDNPADRLQLCAQAMCLEEMLCCPVPEGALFYGANRRRSVVPMEKELQNAVREMLEEMHRLFKRGHTPKVKPSKACNACSLKELCLPALLKRDTSAQYLKQALEETV